MSKHHRRDSSKGEHCGGRGHRGRWRRHWRSNHDEEGSGMGGTFGVRRPLRFLARRLELSEEQIASLAEIIDDLKTERAQAAVDDRRAQKLFVEAFVEDSFDEEKAKAATDQRIASTKRVQKTLTDSLARIHALLDAEQRRTLAYLIRSGALSF